MDYSSINTFLKIAETRSISKAAEALYLSQSTVSHRLKILEQDIGAELINREKGKGFVTLTVKGEEFINIAQRYVSLHRDIDAWKTQESQYKLNIGCVDSLNICVFNELYKELLYTNSPLTINIGTHWTVTIYQMIENYNIDIGFAAWILPSKNVVCKPLFSEKMVLISSTVSNFPSIVNLKDLDPNKEIYMYCGPRIQTWHESLWENTSRKYTTVDTAMLLSSFINIPNFWSIVPISVAKKLSINNNIKISTIAQSPPERVCYQITNKNPIPNKLKAIQTFDEYIKNFVKSDYLLSILS